MRPRHLIRLCSAGLLWCLGAAAYGVNPVDVYDFESAAQEERYRTLIAEFRCPKCLNTNLPGSDAPIAQDLRRTVYRLAISENRSDDEVREYLHERYGDFVLYDPPIRPATWVLWFGPVLLLLLGAFAWRRTVQGAQGNDSQLSDDERARLAALLKQDSS